VFLGGTLKKLIAIAAALALVLVPVSAASGSETQEAKSWGLDAIDGSVDGAFNYPESAGEGVRVYVLDTGVQGDLMSFGGRVQEGYDATSSYGGRGDVDCHGHGTHVAGTIASEDFGVAKKATVIPVKVATCRGGVSSNWILRGLTWVMENHPKGTPGVINLSIAVRFNEPINNMADNLYREGLVVVAAAGNYRNRVDACNLSPSSTGAILTVGSLNDNGYLTNISNWDSCVDLYAPGGSITSEDPFKPSRVRSGTSMAAPHVAGAAALYLADHPEQKASMVHHLIKRYASTTPIPNLKSGDSKSLNIGFINDRAAQPEVEELPEDLLFEEIVPEVPEEQPVSSHTLADAPRNYMTWHGSEKMIHIWNRPHNFDQTEVIHYRIEYSYNRGMTWRMLTRVAADAQEIHTRKPPVGRLVSFRIFAVTEAGDSPPSDVVTTRIGR